MWYQEVPDIDDIIHSSSEPVVTIFIPGITRVMTSVNKTHTFNNPMLIVTYSALSW